MSTDEPLKDFEVQIQATVVKTIKVRAKDESEATELAHQDFTVAPAENGEEKYNEQTVSCKEL